MHPAGWFDAHLDLAYLAEAGRDLTVAAERVTVPFPPAAVTFPALAQGRVGMALTTIFIQRRVITAANPHDIADGPWCFSSAEEAHAAALRQIAHYQRWQRQGHLRLLAHGSDIPNSAAPANPLNAMILMEGAAGLRSAGDLQAFYDAGVRVLSLAWAEGSRYSGGDRSGGDITPEGREVVAEADRLGIIHDVSHLSEQAFWTLLKIARGPKIATHSNCRALLPPRRSPERNLSDDQIRALADAGGIIGIVLYAGFLASEAGATSADVLRHIQHIEKLTGRRNCIALGTDMDGAFSTQYLPADIQSPAQLTVIADQLAQAGWPQEDINGFAYDHWAKFFRKVIP